MRGQVPHLAQVRLETLTPLHIGAGKEGGTPLEDQVLGGRDIPPEYRPSSTRSGSQVVKIQESHHWQAVTPYIPASSLRGCLRGLYTGALEAAGSRNPEREAEQMFGSTDKAGAIVLNDLLPDGPVIPIQTRLVRYVPATTAAGGRIGRSPRDFPAELVDAEACFSGQVLYVDDTLDKVLTDIVAQSTTLTGWLRTGGRGGPNPETGIPGSFIHNKLFQHRGRRWTITWKLGRYAKSYAKALTRHRRIGRPHAYYLVQGTNEVPGWVEITFDLTLQDEFRLNEWGEEGT